MRADVDPSIDVRCVVIVVLLYMHLYTWCAVFFSVFSCRKRSHPAHFSGSVGIFMCNSMYRREKNNKRGAWSRRLLRWRPGVVGTIFVDETEYKGYACCFHVSLSDGNLKGVPFRWSAFCKFTSAYFHHRRASRRNQLLF